MGIWLSLFPGLSEEQAKELSAVFELSGGQIENISRKTEVDDIISGKGLSMDVLVEYCKAENFNNMNISKRIGF